jgi:hypothetical protein
MKGIDMDPGTEAAPFTLERNAFGQMEYSAGGTRHVGVVPVRAFALSAPEQGVSLISAEGRELAWWPHLGALAPAVRVLVDEELARREFTPVIRRIKQVSTFSTPSIWEVETDRGDTRFVLRGEEDIRRLDGAGRLLITSGQGLGFVVADRFALDRVSRRLLERFL